MCYNPKPCYYKYVNAINKETGEIYKSKQLTFLKDYDEKDIYKENVILIPCGHCEECLEQVSSSWATRAYLEMKQWPISCFVTLTYDNENIPKRRTLNKKDLQDFWKRLRKRGYKIRYLACGEYGPNTRIGDHTITL